MTEPASRKETTHVSDNAIGRRRLLKSIGLGAFCGPALGLGSSGRTLGSRPDDRPNILLVFSDQQRHDTLGCYGRALFEGLTPNLDRLAGRGVRFEYSFTCQPVCGPARSCLQTGKWATETGCFRNGIALRGQEKTIAHYLSQAGYEVGYIGKWHLASTSGVPGRNADYRTRAVPPDRRGGYRDFWLASDVLEFTSHSYDGRMFDGHGNTRQFPPGRYRADVLTDWALEYIEQRKSDKPFFLVVSYVEPHHQNDHRQFEGPHGSKQRFADYRVPGDLADTKGDWRKEMPDYLGCCWSLDSNIGRIVARLEKLGIAEKTLLIYTSDHACHFRTRNSEYKRSCHDNSIRTPLIIHGPGFNRGRVVRELVSLIDLPPTILSAGGVKVPAYFRGRPLQRLLGGQAKDWRSELFVQISESHVGRAIRTHRWKYSVRARGKNGGRDSGSDRYTEDYLYDLQKDPHERNNLVADPALADVRARLAAVLKRRMVAAGEKEPAIEPHG